MEGLARFNYVHASLSSLRVRIDGKTIGPSYPVTLAGAEEAARAADAYNLTLGKKFKHNADEFGNLSNVVNVVRPIPNLTGITFNATSQCWDVINQSVGSFSFHCYAEALACRQEYLDEKKVLRSGKKASFQAAKEALRVATLAPSSSSPTSSSSSPAAAAAFTASGKRQCPPQALLVKLARSTPPDYPTTMSWRGVDFALCRGIGSGLQEPSTERKALLLAAWEKAGEGPTRKRKAAGGGREEEEEGGRLKK